jgi:hypothetical protein
VKRRGGNKPLNGKRTKNRQGGKQKYKLEVYKMRFSGEVRAFMTMQNPPTHWNLMCSR